MAISYFLYGFWAALIHVCELNFNCFVCSYSLAPRVLLYTSLVFLPSNGFSSFPNGATTLTWCDILHVPVTPIELC